MKNHETYKKEYQILHHAERLLKEFLPESNELVCTIRNLKKDISDKLNGWQEK